MSVLNALRCAAPFLLTVLLGGCAFSYTDEAGNRHVIGMMHMTLPPPDTLSQGSTAVRMTSVGLSFTQWDVGTAMALGYNETTLIGVGPNSCVAIKDLAFLNSSGEK